MSLSGRRIVNTRALHQAGSLDSVLHKYGATPIRYPCIAIAPPDDTRELDAALQSDFDLLVLTSANTVMILEEELQRLGLDFSGATTAAVGSATADAARAWLGVDVTIIPDDYSADGLADALTITPGQRILLPQSAVARPMLRDALSARGADVIAVTAYQTVRGRGGVQMLPLLHKQQVDAVTFTSSSTARYFSERLEMESGTIDDLAGVVIACIGEQTRHSAEALGMTVAVAPETHTLDDMIAALAAYYQEQST